MNIQAGMTVKLKNERGNLWNDKGRMNMYMGAIVSIISIDPSFKSRFRVKKHPNDKECDGYWTFEFEDVEEILEWEQLETHYLIHN